MLSAALPTKSSDAGWAKERVADDIARRVGNWNLMLMKLGIRSGQATKVKRAIEAAQALLGRMEALIRA